MKKILCGLILILMASVGNAVVYNLGPDDFIVNVPSPTFNWSIGVAAMTEPSTPASGKGLIYLGTDDRVYLKNDAGTTFDLTQGGAGTSPGGVDTQIQFNNSGSFGGITGFTYDGSAITMSIQLILDSIRWGDATVQVSSPGAGGWEQYFSTVTGGIGISTRTFIMVDGTNVDFSIDDSSATFYDDLYVDGVTNFGAATNMVDNEGYTVGTTGDFRLGYHSANNELRIVTGTNIFTDDNVAFRITAQAIVAIGDTGSMDFVNGSGDLYVEDELEVDNIARLNSAIMYGYLRVFGRTEAELESINPGVGGNVYYNSTNETIAISTGTGTGAFQNLLTESSATLTYLQLIPAASSSTFSGASLIGISTGTGSPTIDQVQEYIDNTGSSGFFTGGVLSDGGSGTLDVAEGEGFIRTSADDNAPLLSFKWSASAGIAVADDTAQYVFVDDAGVISLSSNEFLEAQNKILIGVVVDEAAVIESVYNLGVRLEESIGQAGRFIRRVFSISRDIRRGGLIFGQSGDANRDVTMTAGHLWWGRTDYTITAFNTAGADTFTTYSAGGQEATGVSQWPNGQYDNGGTLTNMTNNWWSALYFYIEPDDDIVMVYGTAQHAQESGAEMQAIPSVLPPRLASGSILAAKFIFQKSINTADQIESAFNNIFTPQGVAVHGNLAGLDDDDHSAIYLTLSSATVSYIHDSVGSTKGDVLYYDGGWQVLPIGSPGEVFEVSPGGIPEWDTDNTGAGGSAIVFDIGDDGGNDSTDVNEIATTGDTNVIFSEPSADKILIAVGNNWPTADTANTGDSATSFFSGGTIEHEWGGLEADVSAYGAGIYGQTSGNATIDIDTEGELETALGGINIILDSEIDTAAELEIIVADFNLIVSTEIDTFNELNAIVADKTLVNEEDSIVFDNTLLCLAQVTIDSTIKLNDGKELEIGSGQDYSIGYVSADDTMRIAEGADSSVNPIITIHNSGVTFATGKNILLGTIQWNVGDEIDGEIIANDTIDNDSIDWSDMTDLTTDGAVSWGNIAEGELANATVIDADIKDDTIQEPALNFTNAPTDNYVASYNAAGTNFTWIPAAGGASEINILLKPNRGKLPIAAPARIDGGSNGWILRYHETTQESASWEFVLDDDYSDGTLYCDIFFSMTSGESDEVQFECYVMKYTPNTDTADWDIDSYDTENVGVTTVAATAGRLYTQTITLTNDDGLAAGDLIRIKISTDSDDAVNDDATGDREFRYAIIRE